MCGRFTLTAQGELIQQALGLSMPPAGLVPRYNVAPSQSVAVVKNVAPKSLEELQWGLVPHWAKHRSIGNNMINARSETAHKKPSFRDAMAQRRCLIPADGWYEWQGGSDTHKQPMYIHLDGFNVFAFAGLWETWKSPEGQLIETCTILTTDATDDLRPLHHRMPVVLPPDAYDTWLHSDNTQQRRALLQPNTEMTFRHYPVSKRVNKPAHDSPQNIVPLEGGGPPQQLSLF